MLTVSSARILRRASHVGVLDVPTDRCLIVITLPVMTLAPRLGPRPVTSTEGPHRQLDQRSSAEIWGRLVGESVSIPGVFEGRSAVSPVSSRALFLEGLADTVDPTTSLASPGERLEPVHLHGVTDTSLHLCLPRARAEEVCAAGWGESHQYADHATEIMVYGPRDDAELAVVLGFVRESLDVARGRNVPSRSGVG